MVSPSEPNARAAQASNPVELVWIGNDAAKTRTVSGECIANSQFSSTMPKVTEVSGFRWDAPRWRKNAAPANSRSWPTRASSISSSTSARSCAATRISSRSGGSRSSTCSRATFRRRSAMTVRFASPCGSRKAGSRSTCATAGDDLDTIRMGLARFRRPVRDYFADLRLLFQSGARSTAPAGIEAIDMARRASTTRAPNCCGVPRRQGRRGFRHRAAPVHPDLRPPHQMNLRVVLVALLMEAILSGRSRHKGNWHPSEKAFPVQGIDVSHHQGTIAWRLLKAQGVDRRRPRGGGGAQLRDPGAASHALAALRAGWPRVHVVHCFLERPAGDG